MTKNYLSVLFLWMIFSVAYGQQPDKTTALQSLYEQLDPEKKAEFRKVHEKYREQMKQLLKNPDDPMLKREKLNQLRTSRDSSLKVKLGEVLYEEYRNSLLKHSAPSIQDK